MKVELELDLLTLRWEGKHVARVQNVPRIKTKVSCSRNGHFILLRADSSRVDELTRRPIFASLVAA